MTRVALYARYSSDNQSAASIEDQLRLTSVATDPAARYNRVATTPNDLVLTHILCEVEEWPHSVKEEGAGDNTLVCRRAQVPRQLEAEAPSPVVLDSPEEKLTIRM